jgi:cyclopropane fatty-acyl-phospholipid synthase-like methyltransferase
MKPYAGSCDQNKDPILSVLKEVLADSPEVLEIGTGTGQHAIYFAEKLPHLTWQCSDQTQYHQGIQLWLDEAKLSNVLPPLALNVSTDSWPEKQYDALYSANITHIMHWNNVVDLFAHGAKCLKKGGKMVCYGPFNYAGQYTSEGNAQFDKHLKSGDPLSGIRDFDDLAKLAAENGLTLANDYEMPANNRILVWLKKD